MPARTRLLEILDLALIFAGFWFAAWMYATASEYSGLSLDTPESLGSILFSALVFWVAIQFQDRPESLSLSSLYIILFCLGTGMHLLMQAVLLYARLPTVPPLLLFWQGAAASLLLVLAQKWIHNRWQQRRTGMLILGSGSIPAELMARIPQPILGTVGSDLAGVPRLGELSELQSIITRSSATHLFITDVPTISSISTLLVSLRLRSISVESVPALYEKIFDRISAEHLQPVDIVLSPALRADSRVMAVQSIYTNLIGLAFTLAASPLILLASLAVAVFSGRGPVFETTECVGFQRIPFRLLQFRTRRRDAMHTPTAIGRLLEKLHLVHLPQLINIIRGEIALFGPAPVRTEFARRLTNILPFYSHRFSLRPGILGWAQVHLSGADKANEILRLEYDLFYIKQASPLLDLEILVRSFGIGGGGRKSLEAKAQPSV